MAVKTGIILLTILLIGGCLDRTLAGRRNRPRMRQNNRGRQRPRGAQDNNPVALLEKISEASGKFSIDMYQRLKVNNPNLVFSPFSVFIALSMTSLGARGPSKFQIHRVLRQGPMRRFAHQASRIMLSKLPDSNDNITLQLANGIFLRPETQVLKIFQRRIQRFYNTDLMNLSRWYPERDINNWVEQKTDGFLSDFLSPGSIGDSFMMWIINAVFFRGTWEKKFDLGETQRASFTDSNGITSHVQMMQMVERFPSFRLEELQTSVLELPYIGGRFSFFVFLPDAHDGLVRLENEITRRTLETVMKNMESPRKFKIGIPKFYMDNSLDLEASLKELGITRIFSSQDANLSGIEGDNTLFVDSVIHKSVLEVNEFGTTAVAVSRSMVAMKNTPSFIANKPFMFIISARNHLLDME